MLGTRGVRLGSAPPRDLRDADPRDLPAPRSRSPSRRELEIMIPLVAYEREIELMRGLVERVAGEEDASAARLLGRHDDRAAARVLRGQPDRRPRRLLLVRHQRPHADRARLLARRRRGALPQPLRGDEDRRPQPVRDDRPARRGLARAAGGLDRPRGEARPEARHLRRARRRSGCRSRSSSWPGSTT